MSFQHRKRKGNNAINLQAVVPKHIPVAKQATRVDRKCVASHQVINITVFHQHSTDDDDDSDLLPRGRVGTQQSGSPPLYRVIHGVLLTGSYIIGQGVRSGILVLWVVSSGWVQAALLLDGQRQKIQFTYHTNRLCLQVTRVYVRGCESKLKAWCTCSNLIMADRCLARLCSTRLSFECRRCLFFD